MEYVDQEGVFLGTVKKPTSGWFAESGEKKTPYIRIPVMVDKSPDHYQGGKLIAYRAWLSDAAFDRSIKTLAHVFGWDGDLEALEKGVDPFSEKQVSITVDSSEYQGKISFNVAWLNHPNDGPSEMDSNKVSNLVKMLSRKAKAIAADELKGKKPEANKPQSAPLMTSTKIPQRQLDIDDEDGQEIPF